MNKDKNILELNDFDAGDSQIDSLLYPELRHNSELQSDIGDTSKRLKESSNYKGPINFQLQIPVTAPANFSRPQNDFNT